MTDLVRPFPPVNFLDQAKADLESGLDPVVELIPAPEVLAWVKRTFLTIGSPLYNPEHEHIADLIDAAKEGTGFLTFAWASAPAKNKNSLVLGQCERVAFRAGGWQKARQEQQMREWFGFTPTYLITLDASFCETATDREFCALVDHELCHIGVERDEEGEMITSNVTGLPKHRLVNHDVEEFFDTVRRWGANSDTKRLANIANTAPFVPDAEVERGCGAVVIK